MTSKSGRQEDCSARRLAQAKTLHGEGRAPLLFAPAAFETLASPRGRRDVVEMLIEAQARLNAKLVLEITHLDRGLPPSRLVEVAGPASACLQGGVSRGPRIERRAIAALSGPAPWPSAAVEAAHIIDPEDEDLLTRVRLVMASIGPRMLLHARPALHGGHACRAWGGHQLREPRSDSHMGGAVPAWPDKIGGEVTPAAA